MKSPNFTVDWHSHSIPRWRRVLDRYKGQPGVRALEIGSYEGRSTVWLLENVLTHETARIDCIDTFEGSTEHAQMGLNLDNLLDRFLRNIASHREKVEWFGGESQEVLRSGYVTTMYDFIYIDGSHNAADVLEDAVLSFRLLKIGGLMIFDDYAWTGGGPTEFDNPKLGVDAFYSVYRDQLKQEHVSSQAIFQRTARSQVEVKLKSPFEMVEQLCK